MARTKKEIGTEIITGLAYLQLSSSKTAIWLVFVNVFVSAVYLFELIMDAFRSDIQYIIDNKRIGSRDWYIQKAKEYQPDNTLQLNEQGVLEYPEVPEPAYLISSASALQTDDTLTIKVAKTENEVSVPLTETELLTFKRYMYDVMLAGTRLNVVSLLADVIYYEMAVYYNPIYELSEIETMLQTALDNFASDYTFDNYFYINDFIKYLRDIDFVDDVILNQLTGTQSGNTEAVTRRYELQSGYFNFDATSALTLISIFE